MAIHDKPDILERISQHVELKKVGQNWKGLCPFHTEKTASFIVSPARQHFRCFGCGTSGDVIAFEMKFNNVDFKQALINLGISSGRPFHSDPLKVRGRALKKMFYEWTHEYSLKLADMLRWLDELKSLCRDMDEIEEITDHYHKEPIWQHEFDILTSTNEEAKEQLFKRWYDDNKNKQLA